MKRLVLINPVSKLSGTLLSRFSRMQPLSLAYLAAVTPPGWEVKIADENFGHQPLEDADLVGITAFTANVNRAYELAAAYRERGVKVVMGGIHASMLPEEALEHADAVVVGEAEEIWAQVIADFDAGHLGGVYNGPRIDLGTTRILPRRDLMDQRYLFQSVQTSRGCPFDCEFCSVSRYLGKEYRQRTAQSVLDELAGIPDRYIFFLDDNLVGYSETSRARAKELFQGMIDRRMNKRWIMQSSLNAADHEDLLALAGRSGCLFAIVGFESIETDTLKDMKKGVNVRMGVDNYKAAIRKFHRAGIGVVGGFIVGNDHESARSYEELARFLVRAGVDVVQITTLTPLPGTALMKRLQDEGRLLETCFPDDWAKYRLSYVVHRPEGVDAETVYHGNNYIKHHVYTFPRYQYRIAKSFLGIRSFPSFVAVARHNAALKKAWKGSHYYREYSRSLAGGT
jgi:radical SAM superfamily enzyme YgiQ (UPF0313 family)